MQVNGLLTYNLSKIDKYVRLALFFDLFDLCLQCLRKKVLIDLIHAGELVQVELEDIRQFGFKQNPVISQVKYYKSL